jgi:hypothetical protein
MIPSVSLDAPANADEQPPRFTRLLVALADEIYTGIGLEKRKEVLSSQSIRDGSWELRPRETNIYPSLGWAAQAGCGIHVTPNASI